MRASLYRKRESPNSLFFFFFFSLILLFLNYPAIVRRPTIGRRDDVSQRIDAVGFYFMEKLRATMLVFFCVCELFGEFLLHVSLSLSVSRIRMHRPTTPGRSFSFGRIRKVRGIKELFHSRYNE